MTEILVISDTHLRDASRMPEAVLVAAERADHVVHAGDLSSLEVVRVLEQFAPVSAVHGNVDEPEVLAALPGLTTIVIGGATIGMVHDAGPSQGRAGRLLERFPECDVVVYGHSHQPEATRTSRGPWLLNPGSPTQRRRSPFHSFGWVSVGERGGSRRGDGITCEIVDIDDGQP